MPRTEGDFIVTGQLDINGLVVKRLDPTVVGGIWVINPSLLLGAPTALVSYDGIFLCRNAPLSRQILTDGATVTPDLALQNWWSWSAGGSRTLAAPLNQNVTGNSVGLLAFLVLLNNTAGAIVTTFDPIYKLIGGAWVDPGPGKRRAALFLWERATTSMIELWRSSADTG